MLQLTPHMRIFISLDPVDFRCQIDGLAACCRRIFAEDPTSGAVFVFRNRRSDAIKVLFYDGDAYWLCHRRLAAGKLRWWPEGSKQVQVIDAQDLLVLLWNGDPRGVFQEPWRRLQPVQSDGSQKEQGPDGPRAN